MKTTMQPRSTAQDPNERRQAPRIDVDRRFVMRLDPRDGRAPLECAVIDYSVIGARLELPVDVPLPDEVHILIGTIAHNARVAWRKGTTIGIDFVDEHHCIY
jgi:hypothetical protein